MVQGMKSFSFEVYLHLIDAIFVLKNKLLAEVYVISSRIAFATPYCTILFVTLYI
jgi:hypothetical protein